MNKKALFAGLLFWLATFFAWAAEPAGAGPTQSLAPLATVAKLDVPRYMGRWFEIAKYPNWFQRKCVSDTKADYSLQADGKVSVINQCVMQNGEINEAAGAARQIGASSSPKLQVRFAPAWLSFIPAVWANYWVVDLDPQYETVAVSEPQRKYLWILARTPTIDAQTYEGITARLETLGFDIKRLELTRQPK